MESDIEPAPNGEKGTAGQAGETGGARASVVRLEGAQVCLEGEGVGQGDGVSGRVAVFLGGVMVCAA